MMNWGSNFCHFLLRQILPQLYTYKPQSTCQSMSHTQVSSLLLSLRLRSNTFRYRHRQFFLLIRTSNINDIVESHTICPEYALSSSHPTYSPHKIIKISVITNIYYEESHSLQSSGKICFCYDLSNIETVAIFFTPSIVQRTSVTKYLTPKILSTNSTTTNMRSQSRIHASLRVLCQREQLLIATHL